MFFKNDVNMIIVILLHALARNSVERYQHFGEACYLHVQCSRTTGSRLLHSSLWLAPSPCPCPSVHKSLPCIPSHALFTLPA